MRVRHLLAVSTAALFAFVVTTSMGCKSDQPGGGKTADFSGKFIVKTGVAPDGKAYAGNVELAKKEGGFYGMSWAIQDGPSYTGFAISEGSMIAAGWGLGGEGSGVSVYQVNGGNMNGRTASSEGNAIGTEEVHGPDGLDGTFEIAKGKSPSGADIKGNITIKPAGDVYTVEYALEGGKKYAGVGVKKDAVFVVGWSVGGTGAGVGMYSIESGALNGKVGATGATTLGQEMLAR